MMHLPQTHRTFPARRPLLAIGLGLLLAALSTSAATAASYPDKPIQLVVHTKPGGAVDIMARQLARIASRYCDEPLVVVNKPGGSGLLALAHVASARPDGYTLLAFPAAFLAPIQVRNLGFGLEHFELLALLTVSPEAILTSKTASLESVQDLLADARARPGEQRWCGPGSGSLDHLMAVKIWDKAGIEAKWVPYGGGGPAIAALMGNHCDVYVGNPEDLLGREQNLRLAAVSATDRLAAHPETPTFAEAGIDLTEEVMWRGIAARRETDPEVLAFLVDLLTRISQDPDWAAFVRSTGVQDAFATGAALDSLVARDAESARKALGLAGFAVGQTPPRAPRPVVLLLALIAAAGVALWLAARALGRAVNQSAMIAAAGLVFAGLFLYESFWFPAPRPGLIVGAATAPRVWILLVFATGAAVLNRWRRGEAPVAADAAGVRRALATILLIVVYVALIPGAGFLPATGLMLACGMLVLGHRPLSTVLLASAGVLVFMYVVFVRILTVPLPQGVFLP